MAEAQTYANHTRRDPLFHFLVLPVFLVTLVASIWHAFKYPSLHSAWVAVIALTLLLLAFQVRLYALKVQDRVIRLEETLRMKHLLPTDLQARIGELSPKQFVGLRFADDSELADRTREALDQHLNGEAIKKRIQIWRPDTFRV
jgi:hypothetical protein